MWLFEGGLLYLKCFDVQPLFSDLDLSTMIPAFVTARQSWITTVYFFDGFPWKLLADCSYGSLWQHKCPRAFAFKKKISNTSVLPSLPAVWYLACAFSIRTLKHNLWKHCLLHDMRHHTSSSQHYWNLQEKTSLLRIRHFLYFVISLGTVHWWIPAGFS